MFIIIPHKFLQCGYILSFTIPFPLPLHSLFLNHGGNVNKKNQTDQRRLVYNWWYVWMKDDDYKLQGSTDEVNSL